MGCERIVDFERVLGIERMRRKDRMSVVIAGTEVERFVRPAEPEAVVWEMVAVAQTILGSGTERVAVVAAIATAIALQVGGSGTEKAAQYRWENFGQIVEVGEMV